MQEIAYYSSPTIHPIFPSYSFYLSFLYCSLHFHTVCRSQIGNRARLGDKIAARDLKQPEMRQNQIDSLLISLLQKIIIFRKKKIKSDPTFRDTGFGKHIVKDTHGRCLTQQLTFCTARCLNIHLLHNNQATAGKLGALTNKQCPQSPAEPAALSGLERGLCY